ncbi:hypothetical protein Tco_1191967 [Tanacetum coccineum]
MLALQVEEGEGSKNPFKPQPSPSTAQPTHEEPILNIKSSSPQKTQSLRQALNKDTELLQTSVPIPNVSDKAAHQERGDSVERAATTATSLEDVQDNSNIAKTQSTATPTEPISQETGSDGGPRRQETMGVPLLKLGLRGHLNFPMIYHLEEGSSFGNKLKADKEGLCQEDQPEDQLGVLSAVKVLADVARVHTYSRRRRAVSTGSGGVSTTSRIVSTAGMIQQVNIIIPSSSATEDKGKAILTESEPEQTTTKLKQRQERAGYEAAIRLQEQLDEEESQRITRDAEVAQRLQEEFDATEKQKMAKVHQAAQGFTEDEWEDIRARVKADEGLTQKLHAEERDKYSKKLSFDEVNELFETTMKRVNTFTPIESDDIVLKVVAGSSKRDAEQELNQESSKRQKIGEGSEPAEESKDELSQEQL